MPSAPQTSSTRLPPDLHRELVRLEALGDGLRRGFRCEVRPNGDWAVSCRSAHRWGPPERMLADLRRLPDAAGWKALWKALFSWPESPF